MHGVGEDVSIPDLDGSCELESVYALVTATQSLLPLLSRNLSCNTPGVANKNFLYEVKVVAMYSTVQYSISGAQRSSGSVMSVQYLMPRAALSFADNSESFRPTKDTRLLSSRVRSWWVRSAKKS